MRRWVEAKSESVNITHLLYTLDQLLMPICCSRQSLLGIHALTKPFSRDNERDSDHQQNHLVVLVRAYVPQSRSCLPLRAQASELNQPYQSLQPPPSDDVVMGVAIGAQLAVDDRDVVLALVVQRRGHQEQAAQAILS